MDLFGVNIALVTVLAVIVLGFVEWAKTPAMPIWGVRGISFVVSYALVGLFYLLNPMTWQLFIVTGFAVFAEANGIWHATDQVGKAMATKIATKKTK